MIVFICVACKHKHDSGDRIEKLGVRYTMCPKCGCGCFTKLEE